MKFVLTPPNPEPVATVSLEEGREGEIWLRVRCGSTTQVIAALTPEGRLRPVVMDPTAAKSLGLETDLRSCIAVKPV